MAQYRPIPMGQIPPRRSGVRPFEVEADPLRERIETILAAVPRVGCSKDIERPLPSPPRRSGAPPPASTPRLQASIPASLEQRYRELQQYTQNLWTHCTKEERKFTEVWQMLEAALLQITDLEDELRVSETALVTLAEVDLMDEKEKLSNRQPSLLSSKCISRMAARAPIQSSSSSGRPQEDARYHAPPVEEPPQRQKRRRRGMRER